MSDSNNIKNSFLNQITFIIEKKLSDEQFGVSELSQEMNMSRSNLLRKVKKEANLSVSQLISQVRLKKAMEILKSSSLNISEVAHQVGFSSTSYFIKCFREYYGFPPGEVGKRTLNRETEEPEEASIPDTPATPSKKYAYTIWIFAFLILVTLAYLVYYKFGNVSTLTALEKSIAVLPFKNESDDDSNIYLINGLMESTINNLQKIQDLKVISRTSTEKYRSTSKSIPEIAEELNVNYFVEGSGQKIGDQILLNIQLIEASTDRHLWARQYKREAKDIFQLQQEIAKDITDEIKAIITPEEQKRLNKIPTKNLAAYDLFLKGKDLLNRGGDENLTKAIAYFQQAIEEDNEFALAYADAALTYYYLDIFQTNKKYVDEIGNYADKALLLDPKLAESLIAKAVNYIHKNEYNSALPYLEKALEYNPNSMIVINFLADFYYIYVPNTAKYLEYALMSVQRDRSSDDSIATSNNYLRLGHALIQTGFIDEAELFINKSLEYNSENSISEVLKAWNYYFKNKDLHRTKELMLNILKRDTTRLEILQEVGKIHFYLGDYEGASRYYLNFIDLKEKYQLNIYTHENLIIATVLSKVGLHEKSEEYIRNFKEFADNDKSMYKHLYLVGYYSFKSNTREAIKHLQLFSKEDNFVYYVLLWDMDSEVDPIEKHPKFKETMEIIKAKFWKSHKEIRNKLEEKGLLQELVVNN